MDIVQFEQMRTAKNLLNFSDEIYEKACRYDDNIGSNDRNADDDDDSNYQG